MDQPLFKRKKSRPTRIREAEENHQDESGSPSMDTSDSPMTLAAKLKSKHKGRMTPQARLSFGADNEGSPSETFTAKKSELSRTMRSGMTSPFVARAESTSAVSNSPAYTSEYLSQLKAANAVPLVNIVPDDSIPSTEVYTADDLAAMGIDDSIGDASSLKQSLNPNAVQVAKKKRERLRALGTPNASAASDQEFISLSLTKRPEEPEDQGPHPESRLMREDDDLGDGEDEMAEFTGASDRVALGQKAKKEESKRRRAGMLEMIDDVELDDDEETREWEEMQVRRNEGPEDVAVKQQSKQVYVPTPIPASMPIPSLGPSMAIFTSALNKLTTSHMEHTVAMSMIGGERDALAQKETELRAMIEAAEMKRAWFNEFRQWTESVADFLDDKFPLLEKLENDYIALLKERFDMVTRRRSNDDEDDACLFFELVPKIFPEKDEDEMDELGRIRPPADQSPQAPIRRERRVDRERRHLMHRATHPQAEDGFSTDSSLPPADAEDFQTALSKLHTRKKELMTDVHGKEFRDPKLGIAARFANWRTLYGEIYTGAWGGLGLVGAWEFWARYEILGWDPMKSDKTLDTFAWYQALYDYSRPKEESAQKMDVSDDEDDEPPLGADGDLVGSLISTTMIPRLCLLIQEGAFDPYSAKDLRRVIELGEQVEMFVPRDEVKFMTILQAVARVFTAALTATINLVKSAVPSPAFDPSAIHGRVRFLNRRYKLLSNMLRWRKYAGERFGTGELLNRLVGEVMLPVARQGWDVGGKDVMRKVVKALPDDLSNMELTAMVGVS